MQITIDTTAITAALGALAGAATAASVIWVRVIKPARVALAWIGEFREDWAGVAQRPGVPGRDGMMVRMAAIENQFVPNGGNSMRDRVDMIERRQITHENAHTAATVAVAATLGAAVAGDENGERAAA